MQQAYVSVIDAVVPSVVEIRTNVGLGSGIVFDDRGDIVTNAHVVGSATTFQVLVANQATPLAGRLVGTYTPDDLAVIRVDSAKGLRPARFTDSSKLEVGDVVLAIGNPLGLASSVTEGIVSATGRTVTEPSGPDSPGATLPDVIQTSASINPGNSGGALVDLNGEVVGIPTLAAVDQQIGGGSAAPGIGFAIPSNTVTNIAGQLIKSGTVTKSNRAALGVRVTEITTADGSPVGVGVVQVTAGGPADHAGIKAGDVITHVNGTSTATAEALSTVLAQLAPGDKAKVELLRSDGSSATVTVVLGQLPGS